MVNGKRVLRFAAVLVLLLVMFAAGWIAGKTGMGSVIDPASLGDLEREFAERMRDVALVGRFTVAGREDQPGRPDRYDISSVEKVGQDQWRFNARMRYGSVDATLPVVVTMRWIGDTPMITLTDSSIPSLGTFTARVFFYRDQYAGTWQNERVGGHMFGKIETSATK